MKVVFDIDGTISFDGRRIDDQIVSQINQLPIDRHQLVFASARPIRDLLPIVGEFADTALVGGNGAIVSQGGDIRVIRPIPTENFELVKQLIARYGLDYVIDDKWNYAARVQQESPIRKQLDPGHLAQNVDLRTITQPIKMILLNLKDRQLAEISQTLRRRTTLAIVEHRGEHNIDLTAAGINKYTTFQILFPHEKFIAFGNDDNDRQLLQHAERSVWIGSQSKANQADIQTDYRYPAAVSGVLSALHEIDQWLISENSRLG